MRTLLFIFVVVALSAKLSARALWEEAATVRISKYNGIKQSAEFTVKSLFTNISVRRTYL